MKKYFALLKLGFDNIDTQDSKEIHRMKIQMRAGFVVWSNDKEGKPHPFPESISFDKMSESRFNEVYDSVLKVISEDLGTDTDTINAEIEGFYN